MKARPRALPRLALPLLALVCAACDDAGNGFEVADRQFRDFQALHPVLLRDCGFHTCHGAPERFFRVYGPGRARLDPDTAAFDAVTGTEIALSYQLALSMIDAEHPERSLLLRKPLAIEAGGAGHEGVDPFGRNVYRTENDAGYLALARWVFSVAEAE